MIKSFVDVSLTKPAEIFCPGRGDLIVGELIFKSRANKGVFISIPTKKIIQQLIFIVVNLIIISWYMILLRCPSTQINQFAFF
jgi:hypothetical protein